MYQSKSSEDSLLKLGLWLTYLYAVFSCLSTSISTIVIISSSTIILYLKLNKKITINKNQKIILQSFIFLFISILITIPFSYDPKMSFLKLLSYTQRFFPFLMAIVFIKTSKNLYNTIIALTISLFLADIHALWQFFNNLSLEGFQKNRIYFANIIFLSLIINVSLIFCKNIKAKCFYVFTLFITIFLLLMNKTRGVWLSFYSTLLLFSFLEKKRHPYLLVTILFLFLITALAIYFDPNLNTRFTSIFNTTTNHSNLERITMLKTSILIFYDYPIVGVGLDQFEHFFTSETYSSANPKNISYRHPHNIFLTFLTETGLIGLIGILSFFSINLYVFIKRYLLEKSIFSSIAICSIFAFILSGMTDNIFTVIQILRLFIFIIGLCSLNLTTHNSNNNH